MKTFNKIAAIAAIFLLGFPVLTTAQQKGKPSYNDMIAAYNKGDQSKAFDIGFAYYHGTSGAPLNYGKALEWFRAAAVKNDMYACEMAGDIYNLGQGVKTNYSEALNWYRKAAGLGNTSAAEKLGDLYYYGKGVKKNRLEAAKWYQKAAEASKDFALPGKLGRMLLTGDGIKKNPEAAMRWLLRADELGDTGAATFIANMHASGNGVPRSSAKAAEWLIKGANAGDTTAMFRLAEAYRDGEGIRRSYVEAYKWLSVVAAKEHNPTAEKLLDSITGRMSRGELSNAKSEAAKMVRQFVTPKDKEIREYQRTLKGS